MGSKSLALIGVTSTNDDALLDNSCSIALIQLTKGAGKESKLALGSTPNPIPPCRASPLSFSITRLHVGPWLVQDTVQTWRKSLTVQAIPWMCAQHRPGLDLGSIAVEYGVWKRHHLLKITPIAQFGRK